MTTQIAAYFNVAETFITDLTSESGYVNFRLNGTWYSAQSTKSGKIKKDSIRLG